MRSPSFPEPGVEQLTRSAALAEHIRTVIQQAPHQRISFADYMKLALYTPDLGYYMAPHPIFGWEGDFTTAPELSPLFGQCVAKAITSTLQETQGDILEIGAGSGKLAADLMSALPAQPEHYYIYEISPALRQRQQQYLQQKLPDIFSRFIWLDTLPQHFKGIILGNEVMDALPAECFSIQENELCERGVTIHEQRFTWVDYPAPSALGHAIQEIQNNLSIPMFAPYVSEIQTALPVWIQSLANSLSEGMIVLIDYGFLREAYYHPQRSEGTLMCHYRQLAHGDPFLYPGLQDITVHVDFSVVGETAEKNGLTVTDFSTQAQFLLESGLIELLEADPNLSFSAKHQVHTLTSPAEMGEMFKVMLLKKERL